MSLEQFLVSTSQENLTGPEPGTNDNYDVKELITRIKILNAKEKTHILNILRGSGSCFTKNSNGYFFNLGTIDTETLDKLVKCLELIEKNRDLIKERDEKRKETILLYKQLIDDKIKVSKEIEQDNLVEELTLKPYNTNISMLTVKCEFFTRTKSKDIDVDELIKLHMKKPKYQKDGVLFRLDAAMKGKLKASEDHNKASDMESITNMLHEDGDLDDLGGGLGDIDEAVGGELEEIVEEVESEEVKETEESIDAESIDENNKETLDEDDNEDEDYKSDADSEAPDEEPGSGKTEATDDKTDANFMYFRKLLNTKGYLFDEDSKCKLQYQEYIK